MKEKLKAFAGWCRRYFSVVFLGFVALFIYVLFFNENSYSRLSELNTRINELRMEIKENTDTMEHYRELNRLLSTSPDEMERIVRENYHMKRPGEEVYVFE